MLLKNKVAVVYGAGGAIGGAVARAFADEGAKVFVTGRQLAPVKALAKDIAARGGQAEAAQVDALDEQAVDAQLHDVMDKAGRLDISFNAIGLPDGKLIGVPLVDLQAEYFSQTVMDYTMSYFYTARLAARRMLPAKAGVIMTVTSLPARIGGNMVGGYGTAHAGKEGLTRALSSELAPHGIRVVGLRPHGIPESASMKEVYELKAKGSGMTYDQFQGYLAGMTHARRVMTLAEVGNVAAFMASDKASGMTGSTVNMTMGNVDD
jgi:NAD(P)-dependent dehydrogenase (short-subunit alcohol dehydrogenase family)